MPLQLPASDPFDASRTRAMAISEILRQAKPDAEPTYGIRKLRHGEVRLLGLIVPAWQRPSLWTEKQNIRFIESIWRNYAIGTYVVNVDAAGSKPTHLDGILVDGRQRLTALELYARDAFPVFGALYSELETRDRLDFNRRTFSRAEVTYRHEEDLKAAYERMAYGGVPHQAAKTIPALEQALAFVRDARSKGAVPAKKAVAVEEAIEGALAEWDPDDYLEPERSNLPSSGP